MPYSEQSCFVPSPMSTRYCAATLNSICIPPSPGRNQARHRVLWTMLLVSTVHCLWQSCSPWKPQWFKRVPPTSHAWNHVADQFSESRHRIRRGNTDREQLGPLNLLGVGDRAKGELVDVLRRVSRAHGLRGSETETKFRFELYAHSR